MKLALFLIGFVGYTLAYHGTGIQPSHGYHVHHFVKRGTSPPPLGIENPMNNTLELEFHAGGYKFDLDLNLITLLWGDDAEIVTEMDQFGKPTKTLPLFHRTYRGTGSVNHDGEGISETGSATVHFFHDGRFTVMLTTQSDIYTVDINDLVHDNYPLHGKDAGHGIHMSRFSHLTLGEAHANEHTHDPVRHKLRQYVNNPQKRRLSQLIPFTNCFTGQATNQRAIRMGLVSDPAYYGLYTNQGGTPTYTAAGDKTVSDQMITEMTRTSDVYSRQLRVWLLVGRVITGSAAAGLPMAAGSLARTPGTRTGRCTQTDGSARLTTLRQWRQTQNDNNALWHLMTDCHPPPGTVGIAYIGVICHKTYGVGWTNYVSASSTWLTFAHEVGHNFGSPHSFDNGQGRTGGIMDYGDAFFPAPGVEPVASRAVAFNPLRKNDICGEIASSLTSRSTSNIPPAQCWTLYATTPPTPTPAPTNPTPRPTNPPAPTPKPTDRPTTRQPTSKPTTRFPTPGPTLRPTGRPTDRPTTRQPTDAGSTAKPTTTTAQPTGRPSARPTRVTNKPSTGFPTATPTAPEVTVTTFQWVPSTPLRYGPCSPSCGENRQQMPIYECQQTVTNRRTGSVQRTKVADSQCDPLTRPIGTPRDCPDQPCSNVCGDGIVNGTEVCDKRNDRYCCKADCSGYVFSFRCLVRNRVLDAAYMTCENNAARNGCFLFMFQGENFRKFRAVPGYRFFYTPIWPTAVPHFGLLQSNWSTVTAAAGGRNGLLYLFNGLDFLYIDFSDESQGKLISSGNVVDDWGVPLQFAACGSVTAADILYLRWIVIFCKQMYTYVNLVTEQSASRVYPAGILFWRRNRLKPDVGVNAFYFDDRYREIRLFRGPIQEAYVAEGNAVMDASGAAVTSSTNGIVEQGTIITNTTCDDPNCKQCSKNINHCDVCQQGYKVLVSRCIRQRILIDMTFTKDSKNDAFYSNDPILNTAKFVAGHDGGNQSAMLFDGTTAVEVFAPEFKTSPRTIQNFRISVFYRPSNVVDLQRLVTIDNRFKIDFSSVDPTTMKLWVTYDNLTFDCYVEKPLTLNQKNVVSVEFAGRTLITFVNNMEHVRAFSAFGPGDVIALQLKSVVIGAKSGGIQGALDSFTLEEVPVTGGANAAATNKGPDGAVIAVAIVGSILGLCLIVGLTYLAIQRGYCDCEKKDKAQSFSTQQAFNNAVDGRQTNISPVTHTNDSGPKPPSYQPAVRMSHPPRSSAPPVPPGTSGGGFPSVRPPPRPPQPPSYVR